MGQELQISRLDRIVDDAATVEKSVYFTDSVEANERDTPTMRTEGRGFLQVEDGLGQVVRAVRVIVHIHRDLLPRHTKIMALTPSGRQRRFRSLTSWRRVLRKRQEIERILGCMSETLALGLLANDGRASWHRHVPYFVF